MRRLIRLNDKRVVAGPCELASGFMSRFIGLMGRAGLRPGAGLLIEPCNSVHTFFMRFAIDVVYLADIAGEPPCYKVLAVRPRMKPWRADFPVFGARAVLELDAGAAAAASLAVGDVLCLS